MSPVVRARPRPTAPGRLTPRVAPLLVRAARRYLTAGFGFRGGFVTRHFHGVWLAKGSTTRFPADRSLVFFLNHSSWWDPVTAFLLAGRVVPDRHPYAPIERAALDRYPLLDRLGLFGVSRTAGGAKAFLETSLAVLSRPDASLWLTPEGTFRDPRSRPVRFKPGLGRLAARTDALFVPVAIDYRFRDERLPEILTLVGDPVDAAERDLDAADWTETLERALEVTLDRLARQAEVRDPDRFEAIHTGRAGVSPLYDLGRRLRAAATGRRFAAEHASPEGRS